MVETKIFCDKCGKLVPGERVSLKPTAGKLKGREPFDLCPACSDDLLDWFGPLCGPGVAHESPPPEPPRRPKGRRTTDDRASPPSP